MVRSDGRPQDHAWVGMTGNRHDSPRTPRRPPADALGGEHALELATVYASRSLLLVSWVNIAVCVCVCGVYVCVREREIERLMGSGSASRHTRQ